MKVRPKVSICMITYNQDQFIEQAINSVLMQLTDFDFELIIANDCSTDKTHAIIKQVLEVHLKKSKVKYTCHKTNIGMIPNFVWAINQCRGEYIALLDGDDYWTDPLKMQKQLGFLESHSTFSGVASNSEVIYEDIEKKPHLFRKSIELDLTSNDLLTERFFHTATFMFRRAVFKKDFPTDLLSADRTLFLLTSCFGNIKVLKNITAIYRKNKGGISRNVTSKQMMRDFKMVPYLKRYNQTINTSKLKAFIAYTVLEYSFKIRILDFILASIRLVINKVLDEKKMKAVKSSLKVINRNKAKLVLDL